MTANLDSALNSASQVLKTRLSKASPLFLDAKFNVVSDEKYKGKIETIVEWMQEQHWAVHLPQVFQIVERLRVTIGLIYKEDPLCKKMLELFQISILWRKNIAKSNEYTAFLQMQLSYLHAGKVFFKIIKEEAQNGWTVCVSDENRKKVDIHLVGVRSGQGGAIYSCNYSGTSSEALALSIQASCAMVEDGQITLNPHLEKIPKTKFLQEFRSSNPDVCFVAHQHLTHIEGEKCIKFAEQNGKLFTQIFLKTYLSSTDPNNPAFKEFIAFHGKTFPLLFSYFKTVSDYFANCGFEVDFEADEYKRRLRFMEPLEEEVNRSALDYAFYRRELNDLFRGNCRALKGRNVSIILSSIFDTTHEAFLDPHRTLPSTKNYQQIMVEPPFQLEFDKRREHLLKLLEVGPVEEVISTANLETIATIENWEEKVQLRRKVPIKLLYPPHVTRWFDDLEATLETKQYARQTLGAKKLATLFHAFPKIVDQFVGTQYSLQTTYNNPRIQQIDTLYAIPVEIRFLEKTYRGFLHYVVDIKTGICYHRCFWDRSKGFHEDLVTRQIWKSIDFPSLEESAAQSIEKLTSFQIDTERLQFNAYYGFIRLTIEKGSITLFRVES